MFPIANSSAAVPMVHAALPIGSASFGPTGSPPRRIAALASLRKAARHDAGEGPLGNLSAVEVDTLVHTLNVNESEPMTAEQFLLSLGGGRLPSAEGGVVTSSSTSTTKAETESALASTEHAGSTRTPATASESTSTSGSAPASASSPTFASGPTPGSGSTSTAASGSTFAAGLASGASSTLTPTLAGASTPGGRATPAMPVIGVTQAHAESDRCFTSVGDFGIRHPEVDATTPSPATPTQRRAHAWATEHERFGFYSGLNTFGYSVQSVIDHTLPAWSSRIKYAVALPGGRGTLHRIRVAVPTGALGILRVGAQVDSGDFEMRVRTGGDQCGGVHRSIPCDLDARRAQCDVAFEDGEVDGQRSVLVEIFSKSDGPIEFYAQ